MVSRVWNTVFKCLSLQFWWLRIWKRKGQWFAVCYKGLGGPVRRWGEMQYSLEYSVLNMLSFISLAGSLLREKQGGFPASCVSLLPCSLICLDHKDSFPALALCCPLSQSKSTKGSVRFPVILRFPVSSLHPIQPNTVKLEDLRSSKTKASIFLPP